jgi:hypothetical protein
LKKKNYQGLWLRKILSNLTEEQDSSILPSCGLGDAHDSVRSGKDIGTIVIDWDLSKMGYLHEKNEYF